VLAGPHVQCDSVEQRVSGHDDARLFEVDLDSAGPGHRRELACGFLRRFGQLQESQQCIAHGREAAGDRRRFAPEQQDRYRPIDQKQQAGGTLRNEALPVYQRHDARQRRRHLQRIDPHE